MADKKQKILIVDDSEMNRDILAVMLGSDYERSWKLKMVLKL